MFLGYASRVDRNWLTSNEMSKVLGLSRAELYERMLVDNAADYYRVGRRYYFTPDQVDRIRAFLKKRAAGGIV